jgi:phage terminase small subunit
MPALTPKREAFCQAYIETGSQAEAYRRSYQVRESTKQATIMESASRLAAMPDISARVAELREAHRERHMITVDSLIGELEEARQAALQAETPQTSAAVSATMGKAKLAGLDKQVIELGGNIQHGINISVAFER